MCQGVSPLEPPVGSAWGRTARRGRLGHPTLGGSGCRHTVGRVRAPVGAGCPPVRAATGTLGRAWNRASGRCGCPAVGPAHPPNAGAFGRACGHVATGSGPVRWHAGACVGSRLVGAMGARPGGPATSECRGHSGVLWARVARPETAKRLCPHYQLRPSAWGLLGRASGGARAYRRPRGVSRGIPGWRR